MNNKLLLLFVLLCFIPTIPAAWWNSNYTYETGFTITARQDLNSGYPIDLNGTSYDYGAKVEAGKMQPDFEDIAIVCSGSQVIHSFKNYNDFNAAWFELPSPLASGNTLDCNIYYGNPGATYLDTSDLNFHAGSGDVNMFWRMEDNAGTTTILDYSGNNHTGTASGNTNTLDAAGKFNKALTFEDNTNEYASMNREFPFLPNGTIEMWVNLDECDGHSDTLWGAYDNGGVNINHVYELGGNPCGIKWQADEGGAHNWEISVNNLIPLGEWHHLAFTWGAAGAKIYFDGDEVGSNADTSDLPELGCGYALMATDSDCDGVELYLNGTIDEVRVSNIQKTHFYQTFYIPNVNTRFFFEIETGIETQGNLAPDLNVTALKELDDNTAIMTSYTLDGNFNVELQVFDPEGDDISIDLGFGTTCIEEATNLHYDDLNLDRTYCYTDLNAESKSTCNIPVDTRGLIDANYFIVVTYTDGAAIDFNASGYPLGFLVDNTAPATSQNYNYECYAQPFEVQLTCADGLVGCSTTYYRESFGDWNSSTTSPFNIILNRTTDGNTFVEYYSDDILSNAEGSKSFYACFNVPFEPTDITPEMGVQALRYFGYSLFTKIAFAAPMFLVFLVAIGLIFFFLKSRK